MGAMMKYEIDIERQIYAIRTFEVEADNWEEARFNALELAKRTVWDMSDAKTRIESMSRVD